MICVNLFRIFGLLLIALSIFVPVGAAWVIEFGPEWLVNCGSQDKFTVSPAVVLPAFGLFWFTLISGLYCIFRDVPSPPNS